MTEVLNSAVLIANFAAYLERNKVSDKRKNDSRSAAAVLVNLHLPDAKIVDNAFVRSLSRNGTITIRRQSG
jgi:hypothetical protein